jgi:hypothetical protein
MDRPDSDAETRYLFSSRVLMIMAIWAAFYFFVVVSSLFE